MIKFFKNNRATMVVLIVGIVAIGVGLFLPKAKAQPYYTNSSPGVGAQQYNQNYTPSSQAGMTIAKQQQAGILYGTFSPAPFFLLTNTFSTNIYTTGPIITASAFGSQFTQSQVSTNEFIVVTSTASYFVLQAAETNITIQWLAIGH